MPEGPQSRTDSSSLPQEAIQAEVARQLVGFDQRAQAQDLEIQRICRPLEEATQREQALREQVRSSAQMPPIIPDEAPRPPLQDAQVRTPIAYQVHDAAAQAVEALRAPAQTAASATSGFWSNFWSGLQGSQRLPSNATPPGRVGQPTQGDSTSSGPNSILEPKTRVWGRLGLRAMISSQLWLLVPKFHRHHLLRPPPPRQECPLCRRGEPKAQLPQVMQC